MAGRPITVTENDWVSLNDGVPSSVTRTVMLLVVLARLDGDVFVSQAQRDVMLSNSSPYRPWLELTNVAGLGETNVTFGLSSSTAGAFSVEMSTNLADWEYLGPATPRY